MTLTSDFFFNVLILLDETNTLVVEFFKSVHKQRFYRVRSVLTSEGQTVWPWKKWSSFSKSACQWLSAYWFWAKSLLEFESEYFSFKWPWPSPLTLVLFVLLVLDEPNTLASKFFKLFQKFRFYRIRHFLKWPWPWPMTLTSDFFKCTTSSRWDEHTGRSNFSNRSINKDFIGYAVFWPFKVKRFDLEKMAVIFELSVPRAICMLILSQIITRIWIRIFFV